MEVWRGASYSPVKVFIYGNIHENPQSSILGKEASAVTQAEETMMTCMENHNETVRLKLLLTSKQPTTIAPGNVRTLYAGGKAAVIAEEMRRSGISLLCLGETRRLQSGQVKLASGETILYPGPPDDSTHRGSSVHALHREPLSAGNPSTHRSPPPNSNHPQENKPPSGRMLPPTTLMMKPRTNSTTNYLPFSRPGKGRML